MSLLGTGTVLLTTNTTGLMKGTGALKSFGKTATNTFAAVGVAAIGAAAALTKMTVDQFEPIDKLAKQSAKLGIATDELQALRQAAELTGVQARQLDTGLQRMVRRIAEAAQGSGEAQGALRELGLDAGRLAQMTPDQQFRAVADAMEGVSAQSDRVRLGFKLFDAEGVGLINTLGLTRSGLDGVEQRMRDLGVTISGVDAAKVEQANDAMAMLGTVVTAVGQKLAVALAPFITQVVNRITDWIVSLGGLDGIMQRVTMTIDGLMVVGKPVFDALTFGVKNFVTLSQIGLLTLAKEMVEFGDTMRYVFVDLAGAALTWLGDNWRAILNDLVSFTSTVLGNLGENLLEFFNQVQAWLRGDGFDFRWRGLTEGFKATVKEFPEVLRRESALVAGIESEIDRLAMKVGESFNETFGETTGVRLGGGGSTQPEITLPDTIDTSGFNAGGGGGNTSASITGIESVFGDIQKALLGGDNTQERIAKASEKTAQEAQQTNEILASTNFGGAVFS